MTILPEVIAKRIFYQFCLPLFSLVTKENLSYPAGTELCVVLFVALFPILCQSLSTRFGIHFHLEENFNYVHHTRPASRGCGSFQFGADDGADTSIARGLVSEMENSLPFRSSTTQTIGVRFPFIPSGLFLKESGIWDGGGWWWWWWGRCADVKACPLIRVPSIGRVTRERQESYPSASEPLSAR